MHIKFLPLYGHNSSHLVHNVTSKVALNALETRTLKIMHAMFLQIKTHTKHDRNY